MLNEHDLSDWDFDQLRTDITEVQHNHSKEADNHLREFIDYIEILSKQGRKQVAALFKPLKG